MRFFSLIIYHQKVRIIATLTSLFQNSTIALRLLFVSRYYANFLSCDVSVCLKILTLCCFLSLRNLYWAEFKSCPTGGYWALPCQCSENDDSWGIWGYGKGWKGGVWGLACHWRVGPDLIDVGVKVILYMAKGPFNEPAMAFSFYLID